jgi:hypothetical protein
MQLIPHARRRNRRGYAALMDGDMNIEHSSRKKIHPNRTNFVLLQVRDSSSGKLARGVGQLSTVIATTQNPPPQVWQRGKRIELEARIAFESCWL